MTTYSSFIESLFERSASICMRRDLQNMLLLDKELGYPSRAFSTIHVAGSNGKGSVSAKIASALQAAGHRVGLYTSPHLFTFRERIAIDSEYISEEAVVETLEDIFRAETALGIRASFFELMTVLAFCYFRSRAVSIAVIETGLGGRWDATNVICPLMSVITSISREHTHILGEDLEAIAAEKAGIIKENIPVVLGPQARLEAIYKQAKALNAPLILSKKISQFYDEENSAIARLALEHLPFSLSEEAISRGIAIRPACRFEKCSDVIFDVAHNPDAVFHLLQALHTFFPRRGLRFVVGFSSDKDYAHCLQLISDVAEHVHLVQAPTPRAATLQELAAAMDGLKGLSYTSHEKLSDGIREAFAEAQSHGELLVITGSFYIMADAKEALGFVYHPPKDSCELNEKILPALVSCATT